MSEQIETACPDCGSNLLVWEELPLFEGEEVKVFFYCADCRYVEGD